MSKTGLLLPLPDQTQLLPQLSGSLLPLVIPLDHTVEKHSQTASAH